ncbi:AAA family ATPase [Lysobacter gummosus]|uniref:AAA family ATPase n=1 Tax=Lysobacter gummosus TaxID=262324 RepID=UPI00364239FB
MAFDQDTRIWDDFLQAWPIERLRTMTLPEYATAGDKNSFVYWMESRLDGLGSIWGGSAFKFGIYSRVAATAIATTAADDDLSRAYDGQYGWYRKFGRTAAEAFEAVRREVIAVATAARDGRLEDIDASPLGEAYRWKIAFHYQSRQSPQIVCVYLRKPLLGFLGLPANSRRELPQSRLYRDIAARRPQSESIVAFSHRLWREWARNNPYAIKLTDGAVRNGYLTLNLVSAPFPENMRGGLGDEEHGEVARFRTDTGFEFESDIRASSDTRGRLRKRLNRYFSDADIKAGDIVHISPEAEGRYLISRHLPAVSPVRNRVAEPPFERTPMMSKPPLNQILFGPPGTGKTYHAIDKALEILAPDLLAQHAADPGGRAVLKKRFDELVHDKLVQFVTFHQSFSYEDFVEGIRAHAPVDGGALRYEVDDGVFKSICAAAAGAKIARKAQAPFDLSGKRIWKMSLGNSRGSDSYIYEECIKNGIALLGYGDGIDFSGCTTRAEVYQRFLREGQKVESGDYAVTAVATFLLRIKQGDLLVVSDGLQKFRAIGEVIGDYRPVPREGDEYTQCRAIRWLRVYEPSLPLDQLMHNQFSQMTIYQLHDGSIDRDKLEQLLGLQGEAQPGARPHVLIIDEINRGNISRIFGELITLIEPSKRVGEDEALEVILPYSKERFGVPGNVHLIGTMNTADRSLTGLDIALRRRFEFFEMPSRPELLSAIVVEGVNIGEMLAVMNRRIEVLLDRDHHLGHAYFMALDKERSLSRLAAVFRNQILPLLQEYFFEDWERIRWVLNDQNKAEGHRFIIEPKRSVEGLFGSTTDLPLENRIWQVDTEAFGQADSYRGIIAV